MSLIKKYEVNGRDTRFFIEPGWEPLIEDFLRKFEELDINNDFNLEQVKQKFGGLRIYFTLNKFSSDDFHKIPQRLKVQYVKMLNLIVQAEDIANKTDFKKNEIRI